MHHIFRPQALDHFAAPLSPHRLPRCRRFPRRLRFRLLLPLASPLPAGTLTRSFSAGGGLRAEMKTAVRSSPKRETRCCPRRLYRALIAPYSALFFIADKILLFVAICLS